MTGPSIATQAKYIEQDTHNRIEPDANWITPRYGALLLHMSYNSFARAFAKSDVRQKSRSTTNPNARTGVGVLYCKADLVAVAEIRKRCALEWPAAVRVFGARRRGEI